MTTRKWQNPLSTYFVTFFKMCLHTQITVWNILFWFRRGLLPERFSQLDTTILYSLSHRHTHTHTILASQNAEAVILVLDILRYVKFSLAPICLFHHLPVITHAHTHIRQRQFGPNCYAHHKRKRSEFDHPLGKHASFSKGTRRFLCAKWICVFIKIVSNDLKQCVYFMFMLLITLYAPGPFAWNGMRNRCKHSSHTRTPQKHSWDHFHSDS